MRTKTHFVFTGIGCLGLLLLVAPLHAVRAPEGFTPLFNGKDLSGWHGNNPHVTNKTLDHEGALTEQAVTFAQHWTVENGELVNDGQGPYASTDQAYGDFELLLEYKLARGGDSGVYPRGNPQVQIWDTSKAGGKHRHGAAKGSGGLWNNAKGSPGHAPLVHADRPVGEWNQLRIRLVGSRTWVSLNGQVVVDGALMRNFWTKGATPLAARGPIQLQTHGGVTRWRNLSIREIEAEEANRMLAAIDRAGFEAIFNGVDFTGWQGAIEKNSVVGGAIISKNDTIFTRQTYGDFILKHEFKLPPGGNNGLAIRYSGRGTAAYNGMCEVQVLDNTSPDYGELDPRQYHGSVYGKAAPALGYLRAAGEWNYQTVHVEGSSIRVELNGTVILDADMANISEFMNEKLTPNIPQEGYLGLAGHGDPVAFRNLSVKKL